MTHEEETVERVADAIEAIIGPPVSTPEYLAKHADRLRERNRDTARTFARAAIAALPPRDALLREALEALEPFALHAAEQLDHYIPPAIAACDATPIWGGSFNERTEVTVGDLRRARAAADKIRAALEQQP